MTESNKIGPDISGRGPCFSVFRRRGNSRHSHWALRCKVLSAFMLELRLEVARHQGCKEWRIWT